MWDLMAILAAVFFLLDVAARRIAIDWKGAREGLAGSVAVRKVGDGSVEAWRKARSKSNAQSSAQSGAKSGARATDATAADRDAMRQTLESGPALDVRKAVVEGGDAPPAAKGGSAGASADEGKKQGDAADTEDTTSRLLRAKRRATGGEGDGDASGGGGAR